MESRQIITIAGGKGGTGKSTFAINLALTISGLSRKRVLLADADFNLPNLAHLLGIVPEVSIENLLRKNNKLVSKIKQTGLGFDLLCYRNEHNSFLEAPLPPLKRLLRRICSLNYDYIIFDISAGIHNSLPALGKISTDIIMVAVPTVLSLMDAYTMLKVCDRHIKKACSYYLLVNKVYSIKRAWPTSRRYLQMINRELKLKCTFAGYIPFARKIIEQENKQQPALYADRVIAKLLTAIAIRIMRGGFAGDAACKKLSFFAFLKSLFGGRKQVSG
ncbi:MAG TPA: P-loop NTPase [Spirochaetota bacterium]|nr:P-loop NTPase [Spirochaetota bacterium]